jgi:hypothetical protein
MVVLVYGLAVSRLGYGCEYIVFLNLGQNRNVMVKTGCIWVSMGVCWNGQAVSNLG